MKRFWESRAARYGALAVVSVLVVTLEGTLSLGPLRGLDLAPLLVLFFALELEFIPGLWLTSIIGGWADILSGLQPGLSWLALACWFLLLRVAVQRTRSTPVLFVVGASGATAAGCLLLQTRMAAWFGTPVLGVDGASAILGAMALGWPLHAALRRLDRRFRPADPMALRPLR